MFKVGDEVVKVGIDPSLAVRGQEITRRFPKGTVLTIGQILTHPSWHGVVGLIFVGVDDQGTGFDSRAFRPVAKRSDTLSIESFLVIKPGFEEPKRVVEPVKKETV